VYALEPASGREIWRFRTGDMVTGTPAVYGDFVIFNSYDKHVYAVKADDGSLQWKRDLKGELPSDVVIAGDRALIGSRSYDLSAIDLSSGEMRWQRYVWFSWIESAPNVRDGIACVGTSDALKLFAFDIRDGRMQWGFGASPVATEQAVYAADLAGRVYAFSSEAQPGT